MYGVIRLLHGGRRLTLVNITVTAQLEFHRHPSPNPFISSVCLVIHYLACIIRSERLSAIFAKAAPGYQIVLLRKDALKSSRLPTNAKNRR